MNESPSCFAQGSDLNHQSAVADGHRVPSTTPLNAFACDEVELRWLGKLQA